MKTVEIFGIGTALSSIVHSEILAESAEKNNMKGFRREFMLGKLFTLEGEDEIVPLKIPVISGNAVRGIERRLLFDHMFSILNIRMVDLFDQPKIAREVQNSLRAGGVTAKGSSPADVPPEAYNRILEDVAYIDALGMVFQGHHFESSTKVGELVPYIRELKFRYQESFSKELIDCLSDKIIDFKTLNSSLKEIRYTKRKEVGAIADEEENTEKAKEAMIYGVEYLPAGTILATDAKVTSDHENTILTFLTMYALLQQNAIIGGMSNKGHGFMKFEFFVRNNGVVEKIKPAEIIKQYDEYLIANKDRIINAIKSIPNIFLLKSNKAKNDNKKKAKG